MKIKNRAFSVILFLSVFIIAISLSQQKAEWKGKIEEEKGIKVIKNPREPLYGEIKFELEEDLSIGKEDDDNYMFYGRVNLAVDNQDNIYALDGKNFRIQKYDKNGQYLQTIGRKGQGPGEFELPFKFFIDGQSNIYVYDRRKLKVFNNKGEFLKSVTLRTFVNDFCMSPEGSIFASSELRDAEGSKQTVIEIDSEGELIEKVAEFPFVDLVVRKSGSMTYSFGVSRHVYIPQLYISDIDEKSLCYAHSSEYRIFILDKNGNILHIIQKEESPQSVNRKEKNHILDQMKKRLQERGRNLPKGVWEEVQFPANRPFFDHIMADDKQRLYVRRMKSVLDNSEGYEFDIFSKQGLYLYKTKLPFTPLVIKNGFVYKVEYNENTGEIKIKRLKVKNWEHIKAGI